VVVAVAVECPSRRLVARLGMLYIRPAGAQVAAESPAFRPPSKTSRLSDPQTWASPMSNAGVKPSMTQAEHTASQLYVCEPQPSLSAGVAAGNTGLFADRRGAPPVQGSSIKPGVQDSSEPVSAFM
jgi:hypothetical protein